MFVVAAAGHKTEAYTWEDRVLGAPLGQAIEESDEEPEAIFEKLIKNSALDGTVLGYSFKPGKGLFLLGPTSFPLLPASGWTSKVFGYHVSEAKPSEPIDAQKHFQRVFEGLIKEGMTANEAAAKAILILAGGVAPSPTGGAVSSTPTSFEVMPSEARA